MHFRSKIKNSRGFTLIEMKDTKNVSLSVKKKNLQSGFTLIEILLVLFILLLTSSIVFHISVTISEKRVVDQFFQQLIFDIQEMQALSIENNETIIFQFYNSNVYRAYGTYAEDVIVQKEFPPNITLMDTSNLKRFRINPNGDVSMFGTIKFNTPFGETHLIVYIKEGRMRIVEY